MKLLLLGFLGLTFASQAFSAIPLITKPVTHNEVSFKLWSKMNMLFFDNDGDGYMEVNNFITTEAGRMGTTIPLETTWFNPLTIPGYEEDQLPSGHYMPAFIDTTTFKSYCLQDRDYHSTNPLFNVMSWLVQVEMEGLYIGVSTNESKKVIFITERELKQTWFYYRHGIRTTLDDSIVSSVPVFFVQDEEIFQVKGPNELNWNLDGTTITQDGHVSSYPTHDRKIGCIPKEEISKL